MLGLNRSAVRSWENGDFRPSAESLIRLANQVDYELALEIWGKAGIDTEKLTAVRPKQMLRLSHTLYPFAAGDLVGVEGDPGHPETDPWAFLQQLVVVQFTKYPELLSPDILSQPPEFFQRRGAGVDLEFEDKEKSIRRQLVELYGSDVAVEALAAQDEFEKELAKRWTPDKDGMIQLEAIQAGWLRFEVAGDDLDHASANWPETAGRPWRLVLQAASVKGVAAGIAVPLTNWETFSAARKISLKGKRIKGRVVCWFRTIGPQEAMWRRHCDENK